MLISDWSPDVCSSDLFIYHACRELVAGGPKRSQGFGKAGGNGFLAGRPDIGQSHAVGGQDAGEGDRKSVVEGKSVSVRVDLGGRSNIKNKRTTISSQPTITINNNYGIIKPNDS